MTEEQKNTADVEIKETETIEGEPGDIIEKNGEIFEVEAVEKEPTKSTKKEVTEVVDEKSTESDDLKLSDAETKVDTAAIKMKLLEKQVDLQKDLLRKANLTPSELRQQAPLRDLRADIDRQRDKLAGIDKELNPDEWANQNRTVMTLDADIATKERRAELDERLNSKDNRDFIKKEMDELADKGFTFSEGQIDSIAKVAEQYLVDGKHTKESVQKSLIDILGAETVTKLYEVGGEQKVRKDLTEVAPKVTKSVNVSKLGVSVKLVPFMDKLAKINDPAKLEKELNKLSRTQFAIYEKKMEQKII